MSNLKAIHEATRLQPINKLMVVGHPLSGYASVEQVLHGSGLQAAAASKSQGLSPTQVSDMLLRAYRVQPLNELQALDNFKPIAPSPVWQTLALDLLLGNLEQELWGWADPQAIYLLDYWKNLDHQLAFVLVYDSPQASLASLFDNLEVDCTEHVVKAASDNWLAYNEALLNFYLGNTERCLLVHSAQASNQTQECLAQMKHHMGMSLTLADTDRTDQPPTDMHETRAYLTKAVLATNSKVNSLYADMQSVATLPKGQDKDKDGPLTALRALQSFVRVHRSNLQIQRALEALKANAQEQEEHLKSKLLIANQINEDNQVEYKKLKIHEQKLMGNISKLVNRNEYKQSKLYKLEQNYTKTLAYLEESQNEIKQLTRREFELGMVINKLTIKINKEKYCDEKILEMNGGVEVNKELEEVNQLLILEVSKLKEELEKCLEIQKNENKNKSEEYLASYSNLGAVDRIKNHLSYRLGCAIIKYNNGFIAKCWLPFEILKQVLIYKKINI